MSLAALVIWLDIVYNDGIWPNLLPYISESETVSYCLSAYVGNLSFQFVFENIATSLVSLQIEWHLL